MADDCARARDCDLDFVDEATNGAGHRRSGVEDPTPYRHQPHHQRRPLSPHYTSRPCCFIFDTKELFSTIFPSLAFVTRRIFSTCCLFSFLSFLY